MNKLIRIPWKFYLDHYERGLATPEETRTTKAHVYISADDPHLISLWDDASHYAHKFGPDLCPSIKASAKATLAAIEKAMQVA